MQASRGIITGSQGMGDDLAGATVKVHNSFRRENS